MGEEDLNSAVDRVQDGGLAHREHADKISLEELQELAVRVADLRESQLTILDDDLNLQPRTNGRWC